MLIESTLNDRRTMRGKAPMWMHRSLKSLDLAIDDQLSFDGMGDDCDSGYCFT